MADESRRIDIGFQGGHVLSVRVKQSAVRRASARRSARTAADRWFELETQDSKVSIDLSQVVYVRLDTEDAAGRLLAPRVLAALDVRLLRLLRTRGHSPPVEAAAHGPRARRRERPALVRHRARRIAALVDAETATVLPSGDGSCSPRWSRTRSSSRSSRRPRPELEAGAARRSPRRSPAAPIPSAHASTSFAGGAVLSAAGCPRRRSTPLAVRDGAVAALPRACTTRRTSWRPAPCSATPWHASTLRRREDRHRRACRTRASPRSSTRSRAPARQAANYPFTTVEPNVAVVGVPDERLDQVAETDRRHADRARGDPVPRHRRASCAARTRARGSATSSSATSARPTRSCTWCASTTTRRWSTPRAAWTRSPTSRRSRPSCCSPTSSRPSAGSSAWPSRRSRATRWRWPRSAGCDEVRRRAAGGARRCGPCPCPRTRPGRDVRLQALTSKPVLYVANVAEGEPLEPPPALVEHARGARRPRDGGERPAGLGAVRAGRRRGGGDARRSSAWPSRGSTTVIREAFALLDLISFFTAGQGKEARAWAIPRGTPRPRGPPGRCTPTWSAASWRPR